MQYKPSFHRTLFVYFVLPFILLNKKREFYVGLCLQTVNRIVSYLMCINSVRSGDNFYTHFFKRFYDTKYLMPNKMNVILLSCIYTLFLQRINCDQVHFNENNTLQNHTFQVPKYNSSSFTYTHSIESNDWAPNTQYNNENRSMSEFFDELNPVQEGIPQDILSTETFVSEPLNTIMLDKRLLLNESSNTLKNNTPVFNSPLQKTSTFYSRLNEGTPNNSHHIITGNVQENSQYRTLEKKVSDSHFTVSSTNTLEEKEMEEIQIRSPLILINGSMIQMSSSLNDSQKQAMVKEETKLKKDPYEAKSSSQETQTIETPFTTKEETVYALSSPLENDSKNEMSKSISYITNSVPVETVISEYNNTKLPSEKKVTLLTHESLETPLSEVNVPSGTQYSNNSFTKEVLSTLVEKTYTTHSAFQQQNQPQYVLNDSVPLISKTQQFNRVIVSVAAAPQNDVKEALNSTESIVQENIPLSIAVKTPYELSSAAGMSSQNTLLNKPSSSNNPNQQSLQEELVSLQNSEKKIEQKHFENVQEGNVKSGNLKNFERSLGKPIQSTTVKNYKGVQKESIKDEKVIDSSLSAQNSFHSWSTTNGFISPLTNAVIQKTSRVISPTFLPSLVNTMSIICKKISSELFWANVYIGSITRMYFNKKGLGTLDFTKSSIESDTNGWNYTLLHIVTTSLMSCLLLRLLSSCGLHLLPYSSVKKSFQNDIKDLATSLAQLEKNFSKETKRSASVHERLLKAIDNDMYVFPNENQSTEAKKDNSLITEDYLKELLNYVKASQEQNAANGEALKNLLSLFDFLATTVTRLTRNVVNSETQWNENPSNTSYVRSSPESHESDVSEHNAESNHVSYLEQNKKNIEHASNDSPNRFSTCVETKTPTGQDSFPKKEAILTTNTSNEEQDTVPFFNTVVTQSKSIGGTMTSNPTLPTTFTVETSDTSVYPAPSSHIETKSIPKGNKVKHEDNLSDEKTECSKSKLHNSQAIAETGNEKNTIQTSHEPSTVYHYQDSALPSDPFAISSGSENFPSISFDSHRAKYSQTYNTSSVLNDTAYRANPSHGGLQEFNHTLWNHQSMPQQTMDHNITSSQEHRDVPFVPFNHATSNTALSASERYSLHYERHVSDRSDIPFPDRTLNQQKNVTLDSSYNLGSLQFNKDDYRMNCNKTIQQPSSLVNARSNMQTFTPSRRLEENSSLMGSYVNPSGTSEDSNIPFPSNTNQINTTPFLQAPNQERKIVSWASLSQQAKYKAQAKRRPVPQPLKGISDPFAM